MRRWLFGSCLGFVWLTACGSDEAIVPPVLDATDSGIDPCAALDVMLSVPGVPERLCALNQSSTDGDSAEQCVLCAASVTAAQALFPPLSCPTSLNDCPIEDASLSACFKDVGQLMTEVLPGCSSGATALDPMTVALRVATSSCGPVVADCPPLQELIFGLLGAAL